VSKPKKISKGNKKQDPPLSSVKPTKVDNPQYISFSYKYLKNDNHKFCINSKSQEYIANYLQTLLERLRDLSSMTVNEITVINAKSLRCHKIDWADTTETCFGLMNEDQLVDIPYQFQLSSNEYGRIHGFFIENVFYVVWLDPDHLLYSKK
jgi:hypothetical protein